MTFSIFDWLVISIGRRTPDDDPVHVRGLTQEEIRELQRMRREVRLARELADRFVSQNRRLPL
ncbi:MAG: hypothetical protein JNM45_09775 [Rhizobiales bacterium]|nr:hypothetical protein [Hyphomicrobiales bacterium]